MATSNARKGANRERPGSRLDGVWLDRGKVEAMSRQTSTRDLWTLQPFFSVPRLPRRFPAGSGAGV